MTLNDLTELLLAMAQDLPQDDSRPDRLRDVVGRVRQARRNFRLICDKAQKSNATVIAGLATEALNALERG